MTEANHEEHGTAFLRYGFDDGPMYVLEVARWGGRLGGMGGSGLPERAVSSTVDGVGPAGTGAGTLEMAGRGRN